VSAHETVIRLRRAHSTFFTAVHPGTLLALLMRNPVRFADTDGARSQTANRALQAVAFCRIAVTCPLIDSTLKSAPSSR
jgi:hypothetical protein